MPKTVPPIVLLTIVLGQATAAGLLEPEDVAVFVIARLDDLGYKLRLKEAGPRPRLARE